MADSINSTTTPAFSRRSLLTGAGALPLAATARAAHASPQDPALALWRDWQANFQEVTQLVRKWQRLETRLFATSCSPRVSIRLSDRDGEGKNLVLFSPEDIERWLPDASAAEKARLRAELEDRERRWREAKREIGFDVVDAELNAAYDRRRELMALTGETSAAGLSGVAAKLAMIIQAGQDDPGDEESPWPQLRSTLANLARLAVPEAGVFLA